MRNLNPPESGHTYCFTVPEWVAKRITRHYPDGGISAKAMRPFWRRMKNPAYRRRIFERVDAIWKNHLDETGTEPSHWPRNLTETLGVFAFVSQRFEDAVEEMVLQLSEEELAAWEEKVKQTGRPLEHEVLLFIQERQHEDHEGEDWKTDEN